MCLLQPPEESKEGEEGDKQEEEEVIYRYIPPEPKEWASQGSEKEVAEENVVESRGKVGSCTAWGDGLAQWLERWTGDPKVRGSNPVRSTRKMLSFS